MKIYLLAFVPSIQAINYRLTILIAVQSQDNKNNKINIFTTAVQLISCSIINTIIISELITVISITSCNMSKLLLLALVSLFQVLVVRTQCPTFVTRNVWGARSVGGIGVMVSQLIELLID